jgi:uncharacterized protein YcfL
MKTLLILALAAIVLAGCYSRREIQVEMVSAQLIKIDTIYRYAGDQTKQQLTWRDNENMEYISYAPLQNSYFVGTRMAVLRTR